MKILITGGAGYIGSILCEALLSQDYEIVVIDNFMYQSASLSHLCANPNLRIIRGDAVNVESWRHVADECDFVIPLAAIVGAPACAFSPMGSELVNKVAIDKLLDSFGGQKKIIMPTSNSAYGSGDGDIFCDETTTLKPISKYAIDKVLVEERLRSYDETVSLRLATVFGVSPRMRTDLLVNDFVLRAVRDGTISLFEAHFKRNYIHVRDVAQAITFCINNWEKTKNEIFNVGLSSANLSKFELCDAIKKHLPQLNIVHVTDKKDPDQRNYIVSNEKFEQRGWTPKYDLDSGIDELIKGYSQFKIHERGNI
jgi:nucleoside-diphosphate-sugar epimerase